MVLSDEDLGVLNALMYNGDLFSGKEGKTLGEIIDAHYGGDYSASEKENSDDYYYARLAEYARGNEDLANLKLVDIDSYHDRGSSSVCFQENGRQGDNLYVVLRGTGTGETIKGEATNSEWYTDAQGMASTDTDPQIAAKNYVEYCKRAYGGNVTVTGHSNGGNKAMYAAITSLGVARCVAFDGQGFSKEFFDKYDQEIQDRSSLIRFYGLEADYVGPLLKKLPVDVTYVKYGDTFKSDVIEKFVMNHGMQSMFTFDEGGNPTFAEGKQSEFSKQIEAFIDYIYSVTTYDERLVLAPALGELLDCFMGTKGKSLSDWAETNAEGCSLLLSCLILYDDGDALISAALDEFKNVMPGETRVFFESFRTTLSASLVLTMSVNPLFSVLSFLSLALSSRMGDLVRGYLREILVRERGAGYGSASNGDQHREFTEAKRQELLGIIKEVNSEPWFDPTKWDVWYRGEKWFGRLTIQNYQNDMKAYYRKTFDIEDTTASQINPIFESIERECGSYASKVKASKEESLRAVTACISRDGAR